MESLRWVPSSALLCAAFSSLTACAGAEAERPGFEITDSAGVVLVRNPAEAADSTRAPRLTPDLRIGVVEGTPEYQFGQIVSVDEDSGGEIYVLDRNAFNVRVYDAEGTYVRTIGRQGEGPGEFAMLTALRVGAGDTLYVVENQFRGGRLHVFAPDGAPVRTGSFSLPAGGTNVAWHVTRQGDVLLQLLRAGDGLPDLLLRVEGTTNTIDTLAELHPVRPQNLAIFSASPHWTELDDGGFVVSRTDEYRLLIHDAEAAVERIVTREASPVPISESEKEERLESARASLLGTMSGSAPPATERMAESRRRMLEGATVADHYPIQTNVTSGPRGSLWVQRFEFPVGQGTDNAGTLSYDVFDAEGLLVGSVRIPSSYPLPWIRRQHLYQVVRDDLGVQYVQRIRIDWGDGG